MPTIKPNIPLEMFQNTVTTEITRASKFNCQNHDFPKHQ